MCIALDSRLPVKLAVQFPSGMPRDPDKRIAIEDAGGTFATFALRLSCTFAVVRQLTRLRPRGAPSRHHHVTQVLQLVSCLAYHIVRQELDGRETPAAPDIRALWNASAAFRERYAPSSSIRSFVMYLALRSLLGARDLEMLGPVQNLVLGDVGPQIVDAPDIFYVTYIQPYMANLNASLVIIEKALRPLLFGPPGALAEEFGLRPKSAV
jgi:hypothetical protein